MIIHRAFYREAAITTLGVAAVLLIVMSLISMTQLLGRAARGGPPETVVFILFGYQMLGRIDVLLPLALYLGVLLTLSRWYRDSEMTVLAACGIGLAHFVRPVMILGVLLGGAVVASSFYLTPYSVRAMEKIKAESTKRADPEQVAAGVFTDVPGANRIFYTEKLNRDGSFEGVFVSSWEHGRQGVLVAKAGRPFTDPKTGDKFVAMRNGTLYEGEPGLGYYRIMDFEVYNLRLKLKKPDEPLVPVTGQSNRALLAQLGNPEAVAELHWRLAKVLALFVLAIYAMVFAYTDLRRGRLSNFFVAIVVYFVYSNLIGIGQTMVRNGSIPPALGLWWIHIGMAAMALYLLWQRHRNRPLLYLPLRMGSA